MIKIIQYKVGVSPKRYIQNLVNMLGLENGQIIIKVQNKNFIHLSIQPTYRPDEIDATEVSIDEIK